MILNSKFPLTAVLIVVVVASCSASFAQLVFNPTTTLTAETANNTSAANSFTALSDGDPAAGNVSKLPISKLLYSGSNTAIYAHFMPWFGQSSHINVGYNSDDPAQVHKQVVDMISRGIGGVIIDWYGPNAAVENNATLLMKTEAENNSGFVFAVQEDVGALNKCANTSGCSVTTQLISDLTYAYNTYEGSTAYMKINGRPVVFFFGVDQYSITWSTVRTALQSAGNPYLVFNGSNSLTHTNADGFFVWVIIDTSNPDDENLSVLSTFYSGLQSTSDFTYGASYLGFNESLAPWVTSNPRIMNQHCGQTWLDTFNQVAKSGYSSSNQLQALQIVTWNDYEEGTEIETGVGNCITVSPSTSGTSLNWAITGNENAVDHYTVFISLDGENLMKLVDVASGIHTLDLSTFKPVPGTNYQLFVEAIGSPSFQNVMSASVAYEQPLPGQPTAVLTVSPTSGTAPLTVTASLTASSPNGTITSETINFGDGSAAVSGFSATHTYSSPGTFTVTATVIDSLNATASTTQKVTVSPAAPKITLSVSPTSGVAPLKVSASLTASSPDGTITGETINFGDGSATVSGFSASHTYSTPGTFTVTASVTDSVGGTASATHTVTVSRATPTAVLTVSPTSGKTSLTVSASLSKSSSPDANISSYSINFGDGTTATTASATHIYYVPGKFTVTGTVVDSLGATASATQTVNVTQGCSINSSNRTVTICSPAANATVSSPVQIVADATDSKTITKMVIYLDGNNVYQQTSSSKLVNKALSISTGTHTITVKAWDASGSFSKTITIKVH